MSLLLSWETPPELYDTMQAAVVAELTRGFRGIDDVSYKTVTDKLPWGFYEDVGTSDVTARYTIQYTNQTGDKSIVINDTSIRRWVRPANSCRIEFAFTRPDTAPWAGCRVKLMDMPSQHWVRDLWMNRDGTGHMILQYGAVARLEVEGLSMALEFAVPHKPTLYWRDLQDTGTWVRVDERSLR